MNLNAFTSVMLESWWWFGGIV